MKSCPKCNRTFPDEGQKFCTFDGGLLIAPQTFDPNATIRATSIDLNAAAERPTSRDLPDPNATIMENYPATVALPRNTGPTTGPTGTTPNTSDIARPPAAPPPTPPPPPPPPVTVTPPPPPPPAAEAPAATVQTPAIQPAPSAPLPPPVVKKKSKAPLIIGGILLFLLLSGGALAGLFFLVVKPRLDEMAGARRPERSAEISTPTPTSSVQAPSPAPTVEDTFVPPSGTVQFANSNANLDGKLAEHYVDFSFYYPKSWVRDPKSGVAGASNFVKVDRLLPPDFTQENFAVGWYTSTGTFVGDLPNYPQRVEEFSKSLARIIPDYKKVSEGPTKVNSMDAYEFRWEGLSKGTEHGDLNLWGRVIFLPTGNEGDTTGATLTMLCTSLAGELSSVEDVGVKGESPVILDSFRFGKKSERPGE
jgi:outer membrane biosynthesis protein TonB